MTRAKGKRIPVTLILCACGRIHDAGRCSGESEREWIEASQHPSYWRNNNGKR